MPGIARRKVLTYEDIKRKLLKHYVGRNGSLERDMGYRDLEVSERENSIFFSVSGTPPKGYGIYIPENRHLSLYDHKGKRFKRYNAEVVKDES